MSRVVEALVAAACLLLLLASSPAAEDKEECRRWFELSHDPAVRIRITAQDGGTLGWDPSSEEAVNTLDPARGLEGTYTEGTDGGGRPSRTLRFGFCSTEAWPLRLEVFGPATARQAGNVGYTLTGTIRDPRNESRHHAPVALAGSVEAGNTDRYRVELVSSPRPAVRFVRESGVPYRIVRRELAPAVDRGDGDDCPWFTIYHGSAIRIGVTAGRLGKNGWDPMSGAGVNTLDAAQGMDGAYQEEEGFDGPYWRLGLGFCAMDAWPLVLEVYGVPDGGEYNLGGVLTGPPPEYRVTTSDFRATIPPGGTHRYRLDLLPPPLDTVRFVREDAVLPRFASPLADADPRVFPVGSVIPVAVAVDGPLPEAVDVKGGATLRLSGRGWQVEWVHPAPKPGGKFGRENRLEFDDATRSYRYDLATETLGRGTWLLEVTLGGMGPYTIPVEVRAP